MSAVLRFIRQLVPLLLLPLCLLASVLASSPWLRSFPLSVAGASLFGAAILSVLVPVMTVRLTSRLWLGALVDVAVFFVYALVVVLQDPSNVNGLVDGLYRGPSELLTFALPLISPRNLMVAPVALTWLAGALAGECIARRWYTLLPYVGFLVSFGLAYAATQRAAGADPTSARLRETLLGAGLLATLLVMRVAQSWVRQDETAESTQPDGVLPLRGLVVGTVTTLVVALGASLLVQSSAFPKSANTPQREPSINDSNPLAPVSFVAGLRPRTAKDTADPVFTVTVDKSNPGYFELANVDSYDGSGWSFQRTFRPSGGVLPRDSDVALRASKSVTQQYRIAAGPLTGAPWMPFLYRAQKVFGASVNIDPASGMIVPADRLSGGRSYMVTSRIAAATFPQIKAAQATPDTATSTIDTQLPPGLRTPLDQLVQAFTDETGVPSSPALPFLQALQKDLQTHYALSSAAQGSAIGAAANASSTPSASTSGTPSGSHSTRAERVRPLAAGSSTPRAEAKAAPKTTPKTTPKSTPTATPPTSPPSSNTGPAADVAGSTGFADVLASILGPGRSGTPEQFATLVSLVARDLGVPARVATGFRVVPTSGASTLAPGRYDVTTADAWTWVEIPIVGVGWVILDASPGLFTQANQQTESAASPPPSTSAVPSKNAQLSQGNNGHAVAPKSDVPAAASAPPNALLIALVVGVGGLLLALLVVLFSRKRVRAARRRRSPDPRSRIIGAWRESIDVLTEAGLPDLTNLTSAEIATLAGKQFGAETGQTAAELGSVANAVTYSSTAVMAADADAAWTQQRVLRKQVRGHLGLRGRLRAGMRYHRSRRVQGPVSPPSWIDATRQETATERRRRRRAYHGRRRAH